MIPRTVPKSHDDLFLSTRDISRALETLQTLEMIDCRRTRDERLKAVLFILVIYLTVSRKFVDFLIFFSLFSELRVTKDEKRKQCKTIKGFLP